MLLKAESDGFSTQRIFVQHSLEAGTDDCLMEKIQMQSLQTLGGREPYQKHESYHKDRDEEYSCFK